MKLRAFVFSAVLMLSASWMDSVNAQYQATPVREDIRMSAGKEPAENYSGEKSESQSVEGPSKLLSIIVGALLGAGTAILIFRRRRK